MKNNAWKTGTLMAISVLVLMSATSAYGQTSMRFNIPFQFLAGDQVMPAGDYRVEMDLGSRTLNLRHESGRSAMYLSVTPTKRSFDQVEEGKLLFKSYGNVNVLARVWTRGDSVSRDLPVSKAERELARTQRAGVTIQVAYVPAP